MNKLPIEINILITGIIIVFLILTILILAIKLFGILISKINDYFVSKKQVAEVKNYIIQNEDSNNINEQIIAVISASVYSMYSNKNKKVIIKSIRKEKIVNNNMWGFTSIISNIKNI